MTKLKSIIDVVMKQEEMLQFDHFNNRDAWDLGKLMVEEIFKDGIDLSVCIRKLNGNIIFQYATEKTALNHQNWMKRKFNTVSLMERSSLAVSAMSKITGEDVAAHGLSDEKYVFCGGGFPVRIKGSGIVAVITTSNLTDIEDHNYLVKYVAKYLGVKDVPLVEEKSV